MPTTSKRYPNKRNKDGSYSSIGLTPFATVAHSSFHCVVVDQALVCDSAFLAERGIFSQGAPVKHPASSGTQAHHRRGEAA